MEHSTMPQIASQVGSSGWPAASGLDALIATCVTRRQAKRIQTTPVAKRHKTDIFLLLGIWRFQVRNVGSAITMRANSQQIEQRCTGAT